MTQPHADSETRVALIPNIEAIGRAGDRLRVEVSRAAKTGFATQIESIQAFQCAKAGHTSEELEDALALSATVHRRALVHLAVADGATEGFFSRRWAEALSEHFVGHWKWRPWTIEWLKEPAEAFRAGFDISALPWFAQEKAGRGGFATLLGLTLDLGTGRYRFRAIGDSCLAIVCDSKLVRILPPEFSSSDAFNSHPYLLGSNPDFNGKLATAQRALKGTVPRGATQFLLMTDALGSWFASELSRDARPWAALDRLASINEFEAFITELRMSGRMRNDDVTLVRVRIPPSEKSE